MVRIRCREENGSLVIIWEDDGPGIPPDQKESIFQTGIGKNTGLGLFLSKEILDITGFWIKETGIFGMGARFEIMVPYGRWQRRGEKEF
ncbi:MAG: HAMP domain-containing histidine kinase [Methanospirillaceae archaeon]|nr:HAMP domain-containing histidine kinase [Methanospirillaceae archaeon]